MYHPPSCTFVFTLSVFSFLCQIFICCFYALIFLSTGFSKPLKKLGNSFFLLQSQTCVLWSSLFHLHLTIWLIFSSSNWNPLRKPCGWLSRALLSCLPFVLILSAGLFTLAQFVVEFFRRHFLFLLPFDSFLPQLGRLRYLCADDTTFSLWRRLRARFILCSSKSSSLVLLLLVPFPPNDHVSEHNVERTQVLHLTKARRRMRWRRRSGPLFPGVVTLTAGGNVSGWLRAWQLLTSGGWSSRSWERLI